MSVHYVFGVNLTLFVEHPGGSRIILKYAGKDATYVPRYSLVMTVF